MYCSFVKASAHSKARLSSYRSTHPGPYAPAVLRFHVSFPTDYPESPPVITFTTDIFHPLVTPLTTYSHFAGTQNSDTRSASDEERLPPGGFSLRYGFPSWFCPTKQSTALVASSGDTSESDEGHSIPEDRLKRR